MRHAELPENLKNTDPDIAISVGQTSPFTAVLESFSEFSGTNVAKIYENGKYIEFVDKNGVNIAVYSPIGYEEQKPLSTALDFSFFYLYNSASTPLNCRHVGIETAQINDKDTNVFRAEARVFDPQTGNLYLYINADMIKLYENPTVYRPREKDGIFVIPNSTGNEIIATIGYDIKPQYRIRYFDNTMANIKTADIDAIDKIASAKPENSVEYYEITYQDIDKDQEKMANVTYMEVL